MNLKKKDIELLINKIQNIVMNHSKLENTTFSLDDGIEATHRELHLLEKIKSCKFSNITDLAESAKVTKSAASQMIKKLKNKGLVEKTHTEYNRKNIFIRLTKTGEKALEKHNSYHVEHLDNFVKILQKCKTEKIKETIEVLSIIEESINKKLAGK